MPFDRHADLPFAIQIVTLHLDPFSGVRSADEDATPQVRAVAQNKLGELLTWLKMRLSRVQKNAEAQSAHYQYAIAAIARFLENPTEVELSPPAVMPDGSPI